MTVQQGGAEWPDGFSLGGQSRRFLGAVLFPQSPDDSWVGNLTRETRMGDFSAAEGAGVSPGREGRGPRP